MRNRKERKQRKRGKKANKPSKISHPYAQINQCTSKADKKGPSSSSVTLLFDGLMISRLAAETGSCVFFFPADFSFSFLFFYARTS